jgi:(p)ppGpp synthase/HD superfamily hydrolase
MDEQIDLIRVEAIARSAHAGQYRRDGVTPYIEHPKAVVARVKGDDKAEAVAWLHDVIEDTHETAASLLQQGVPGAVVEAVEVMTHRRGEEYQAYLERVKRNPLATKVKLADMQVNLSDSPTEKQIKKYERGLSFLLD